MKIKPVLGWAILHESAHPGKWTLGACNEEAGQARRSTWLVLTVVNRAASPISAVVVWTIAHYDLLNLLLVRTCIEQMMVAVW